MSAIGSYIHYHSINYIRYGITINRPHTGYQSQKSRIQGQIRRQATTAAHDANIREVQAAANGILSVLQKKPISRLFSSPEDYYRGFEAMFEDIIEGLMVERYMDVGNIYKDALNLDEPDIKAFKEIKNINATIKYIQQLANLFERELQDGMTEADWFLGLSKDMVDELKFLQRIYHNAMEFRIDDQVVGPGSLSSFSADADWEHLQGYIEELEMMHNEVRTIPYSYMIKDMVYSKAKNLLPKKVESQVAEMLEKGSKGILTNPKIAYKDIQKADKLIEKTLNMTLKTISKPRDLTFNLSWKENNLVDFRFQKPGAFAMNKFLGANSIRTEIGLMQMLQVHQCGNDYINHFLNIFANRLGAVPERIKLSRQRMIEELQLLSLYSLMRFGEYNALKKGRKIDVFFKYDVFTGEVQVRSIYSLLAMTSNNLEFLNLLMDGKPVKNASSFKLFFNRYWGDRQKPSYPDAYRRIDALLMDAHQRKLAISLDL